MRSILPSLLNDMLLLLLVVLLFLFLSPATAAVTIFEDYTSGVTATLESSQWETNGHVYDTTHSYDTSQPGHFQFGLTATCSGPINCDRFQMDIPDVVSIIHSPEAPRCKVSRALNKGLLVFEWEEHCIYTAQWTTPFNDVLVITYHHSGGGQHKAILTHFESAAVNSSIPPRVHRFRCDSCASDSTSSNKDDKVLAWSNVWAPAGGALVGYAVRWWHGRRRARQNADARVAPAQSAAVDPSLRRRQAAGRRESESSEMQEGCESVSRRIHPEPESSGTRG